MIGLAILCVALNCYYAFASYCLAKLSLIAYFMVFLTKLRLLAACTKIDSMVRALVRLGVFEDFVSLFSTVAA